MIIIIDGPEKVGKSTVIGEMEYLLNSMGRKVIKRHWGRVDPDDRVYTEALAEDAEYDWGTVVIWDRSWVSEHVYGLLLGRDRRLAEDPWLGEWLHGRSTPYKVILTEKVKVLERRRDDTDLPVSPKDEIAVFTRYASELHGWRAMSNSLKPRVTAANIVGGVVTHEGFRTRAKVPTAPTYVGPTAPVVVFVADGLPDANEDPSRCWLPFSSEASTNVGRLMGSAALACGWTVPHDKTVGLIKSAKVVVAAGKSKKWVGETETTAEVIEIPDPERAFTSESKKAEADRLKIKDACDSILQRMLTR